MADNNKKIEKDQLTGVDTTGHEWDGLKELNNPLPRWWLWVFYVTIVWSIWYWVVYPAWPTLTGHTAGNKGWSQYKEMAEAQDEVALRKQAFLQKMEGKSLAEIKEDPETYKFAVTGGKIAFKNHCATCHGSGAAGVKGYPNLNDDDWLWGGSLDEIYTTIKYGIRAEHDDTRYSEMSAFGRDELLDRAQIEDVADYVLSLSGKAEATETGAALFAENCASCHAEDGTGDRTVGAPNIADAIWLYGDAREDVIETITNARYGVMPNWDTRLDEDTIKQLTIYVHSLGGGE